jgi:hypothetical protein
MTSRERIEKAFQHEEPDRTPIFEYVLLPPIAENLLGKGFVDYLGNRKLWLDFVKEVGLKKAVRCYVRDRLELATLLGHDMLYISPNPVPAQVYFHDPLEDICPHLEININHDPVDRLRNRNIRTAELLNSELSQDCYLVYHYLKEEMTEREMDLPVLAPAYFHGIWEDTDLMEAMILDPEVAMEHFSLATRRALKVIEDYIKLNIDQIGIGGDFAGNRLLISPEAYRSFIVPEVRKCARRIRESGCYAVNASDGNLWPVMEDFLFGCEVDGYLEIDQGAGMDLRRLKGLYGDRILLFGNMDCGRVLSFASPEEIRRETINILEAGQGNGGHIFTASNAITSSIPIQNYLAMVNAYREYFHLPLLKL